MGENKITRLCKSLPFLDENQMLAPYAMELYADILSMRIAAFECGKGSNYESQQ